MKQALRLEASVTKSIKEVIAACEDDDKTNDYHVCFSLAMHTVSLSGILFIYFDRFFPFFFAFDFIHTFHVEQLVDYLTGVYLEEQYHGQRDLAGKISTLDKLMAAQGPLGEFLFDKKLLD